MSLVSLSINDSALSGAACCVVLKTDDFVSFTDRKGLALAIPLLFLVFFLVALFIN